MERCIAKGLEGLTSVASMSCSTWISSLALAAPRLVVRRLADPGIGGGGISRSNVSGGSLGGGRAVGGAAVALSHFSIAMVIWGWSWASAGFVTNGIGLAVFLDRGDCCSLPQRKLGHNDPLYTFYRPMWDRVEIKEGTSFGLRDCNLLPRALHEGEEKARDDPTTSLWSVEGRVVVSQRICGCTSQSVLVHANMRTYEFAAQQPIPTTSGIVKHRY